MIKILLYPHWSWLIFTRLTAYCFSWFIFLSHYIFFSLLGLDILSTIHIWLILLLFFFWETGILPSCVHTSFTWNFCSSPRADHVPGKTNQEPNQDAPNRRMGLLSRGLGWLDKSKVHHSIKSKVCQTNAGLVTYGTRPYLSFSASLLLALF